jgi:hypothetical protein
MGKPALRLVDAVVPEPVLPMLASVGPIPTGPAWGFEFKWDGTGWVRRFSSGYGVEPDSRGRGRRRTGHRVQFLVLASERGSTAGLSTGSGVGPTDMVQPTIGHGLVV